MHPYSCNKTHNLLVFILYELPALDLLLTLFLLLRSDENREQKPQPTEILGEGGSNVGEISDNRPLWPYPPSDALRCTVGAVAAIVPSRWSLMRSSCLSSLRISPLKNLSFHMSPDDPCLLNDAVDLCNAILLFFSLWFLFLFRWNVKKLASRWQIFRTNEGRKGKTRIIMGKRF